MTAAEHDAVGRLLAEMNAAALAGDPAAVLNLYTDEAMFVGSGANEQFHGRALLRQFYEQIYARVVPTFDVTVAHTETAGGLTSFFASGSMTVAAHGRENLVLPYRISGAIRHDGDRARFCLFHGSVPAS